MYLLPILERYARRRLHRIGIHSRYVDTLQGRIHLYEAHDPAIQGPPIVILHGLGASATSFGPVIHRLRASTPRILAPETPGHGFSKAHRSALGVNDMFASITQVLARELDEPAIFVGNSLGGTMAIRYAHLHPEQVAGLVLVSPAGAPLPDATNRELLELFRIRSHRDAYRLLSRLYHRPPWYRALVVPDVRRYFSRRFFRDLLATLSQDDALRPAELAEITAPVLLLWGQGERLLPAQCLTFFREHLPAHATIEEPANFGHCPQLDEPRALARRIAEFSRAVATS
ncbi:MAG TPA: alpha/beta fold hydrolase [Nannocystis exedens]|nr:alpha/beta fold hydrolase [Nannocystis exedens]